MINGVGNFLAFADNNVSSNNNFEIINDNSFAEMLNKIQKEDIYSETSANKIVDREDYKNYDNIENNNNDDFQKYLETMENDKVEEFNDNFKNQNDSQIKNNKEENIENKIDNENLENSLENKKTENAENNAINENKEDSSDLNSDKKKIESLKSIKEKAKNIIETIGKNNSSIKNIKSDKNAEKLSSLNIAKEEKENLIKEINDLNKEIKKLESKELNDNEKEELLNLFESLENIKNIILENSKEKSESIKDIKEFQIKNLEEKNIKELKENLKETELSKNAENIEEVNSDYNFDLEDNIQSNKRENKTENLNNNFGNNLNKTISDDNGAELTIINMKDSPESANLKGFNHYNNVSKNQSGNSLTENMIKFQDLMGKLVEKAQVAINNGKSEVLMSLNPEYLGKVRLKISMEGDNFVGKIFVDNAEIKDIFTKNLDTVITSLNEIGINIEGFDVMLRQDMPNEEFSEFADNNSFGRFGGEDGDFVEEVVEDVKNYIVPERKLNLLI
ncbi:flagellar hook-length control protein FliK [Brachyspira catarrhinii]|uniref:Flagellar hook-length control protein FliK n=1 Tax=Brachyspira catarrhinii TaxID=2528966 RepID=A0ABY2TTC8_9SPIR|nr:flagellar hook-length control protein FliK [Brachyspira catarrhinii]TKZ36024.1 flagellar hook-length control protein FliK [Brachyspira catarrhinii]